MAKKLYILVFLLLLVAPYAHAETFEETDVLGNWYVYELDVNPIQGAYWLFGDLTIASTTGVTGTLNLPDTTTIEITSGQTSIDANGSLTGSFSTAVGLTGNVVDGQQDQNHTIFSYVSLDSEDSLGIAVGIKAGSGYQTADMNGAWRFYGIEIDPTLPGLYWVMGDGEVAADGTITSAVYSGPDGTQFNASGGQFSLSANGKVSATFDFENGDKIQVADGMVDILKTFAVFVTTNNNGGLGIDLALKKGGTYDPSDLAGDWIFYNFTIDTENEIAYPVFGSGTIDNNGGLTGSYTAPDSTVFNLSNGQASLSSSGELTGSFTVEGVANETIQSGFMDQNKSMLVFVGTSDNGQMDLGIGFRTSELPAAGNGGGGGGGGSCFVQTLSF